MLNLTILCLFFLSSLARALPTLLSRDVFDPPITSPTSSSVWQSGETVTVTWDTSNVPAQLTNPIGMVVLGYMANATDSEHLMLNSPLAQNFNITDGSVSFVVPSVVTRTDYIIALFGDSGNISPPFTIKGTDASTSTSSSSALSSSTSSVLSTSSTSSASSVPTTSGSAPTATTLPITTDVSVSFVAGATSITTEASVTNTFTSIVTETPSLSTSGAVTFTLGVSTPASSATGSSSRTSSSPSTTTTASSNSAWKVNTRQVYAFIVAGLLATCLV